MTRHITVQAPSLAELNEAVSLLMRIGWALDGAIFYKDGIWNQTLYLHG